MSANIYKSGVLDINDERQTFCFHGKGINITDEFKSWEDCGF